MATYAAGITAIWNGVDFKEVVDLKFTHGGSLPISRGGTATPFAVDLGTIDVVCLGTANCSFTNYGKRATFSVTGGASTFTHAAIFERLSVENKINDVQRFTVTLRFSPT